MDETLRALVERSRAGDRRAFEELVRRYQAFVFKVAYGIVLQAADAEDVAQEAFLKAYTSLSTLRDPAAFPTWLARLTTRLALNAASRGPRWILQEPAALAESAQSGGSAGAGAGGDPQARLEAMETRQTLQEGVRALPPHYRAPLVLRDLHGYSYGEIAALLEINKGTVKSRIHQARLLLRQALGKGGRSHGAQ